MPSMVLLLLLLLFCGLVIHFENAMNNNDNNNNNNNRKMRRVAGRYLILYYIYEQTYRRNHKCQELKLLFLSPTCLRLVRVRSHGCVDPQTMLSSVCI